MASPPAGRSLNSGMLRDSASLPGQYQTFDDANPFPRECPHADYKENSLDSPEDPKLYDDESDGFGKAPSTIQMEDERMKRRFSSLARLRGQYRSAASSGRGVKRAGVDLQPETAGETATAPSDESEEDEIGVPDVFFTSAGELPSVKV